MSNIIDLSVFRKDDLIIKSLTGEEYRISGNFSTEFYLYLYEEYKKVQKVKQDEYGKSLEMLKNIALEIVKLDSSKSPTMQTINEQFDDFNVLKFLIAETMKYANEITSDPSFNAPDSN